MLLLFLLVVKDQEIDKKENDMKNTKFIKTTDSETKEYLLQKGFQLVNESNGIATFINDISKMSTFDDKKVAYTNKLEF